MLERLLPERLGNDYRGHPLALWVFVPLTLVTLWRSGVHMFYADGGAQSIATIPLDRFANGGAEAVILVFALWGLSQMLLGLLYAVVLLRYRALLSLMYLLIVIEYLGRMALGAWKPMVTLERPPGAVGNVLFSVVGVAMLALSLHRGKAAEGTTRA